MKKALLLFLVAAAALFPAFADRTGTFGVAYTKSALNRNSAGTDMSLSYNAIGLSFGGFSGGNIGFYGYDTFALPLSGTATLGSKSADFPDDYFSSYQTKILMDAQFGLGGYAFDNGQMRLLIGAGLNMNMVSFITSSTTVDSFMYLTLGPGAVADFSARIVNNLFVSLQARAGYNLVSIMVSPDNYYTSSEFKNVFSLTPVIGITAQY